MKRNYNARSNYQSDQAFTDFVHDKLAVPIIYHEMGWKPTTTEDSYQDKRDKKDGIDYQAEDHQGMKVTIQERFRDAFYAKYNDFTIRYTREHSLRPGEQKSEFFKIDATYFVYGITNGSKFNNNTVTDFIKYIVFDVNQLKNLFRVGTIRVPDRFQRFSEIKEVDGKNVLYTAKNSNPDRSSEFIAIDPQKLKEVLGDSISHVVIMQKGFY